MATAALLGFGVPPAMAEPRIYDCRPALSYYCANIHIGCSGRSRIATSDFTLKIDGNRATRTNESMALELDVVVTDGIPVLRPADGQGWLRLTADGQYAERIYRGGRALMARGACTAR